MPAGTLYYRACPVIRIALDAAAHRVDSNDAHNPLLIDDVDAAITFTDYNPRTFMTRDSAQPVNETTPTLHNLRSTNLIASGCKSAGVMIGLPESRVSDVLLKDVTIEAQTGLVVKNARQARECPDQGEQRQGVDHGQHERRGQRRIKAHGWRSVSLGQPKREDRLD